MKCNCYLLNICFLELLCLIFSYWSRDNGIMVLNVNFSNSQLYHNFHYRCKQYLSPLKLCVRILLVARCTRYNMQWVSPVSSTNKSDPHDITEILLKVALKTTTNNQPTMTARNARTDIANYHVKSSTLSRCLQTLTFEAGGDVRTYVRGITLVVRSQLPEPQPPDLLTLVFYL